MPYLLEKEQEILDKVRKEKDIELQENEKKKRLKANINSQRLITNQQRKKKLVSKTTIKDRNIEIFNVCGLLFLKIS